MTNPVLGAVPEAKQDRSRQTLANILDAAEELLNDRDFDELTMSELARHAGCAIGTLYGRIPGKDRLLACLYDRDAAKNRVDVERALSGCVGADLETRVRAICDLTVDILSARHGVNRAITAHLFSRRGAAVQGFRRETTRLFKAAARFLAECSDEIAHPDPGRACQLGLLAVVSMAQNRVVDGARAGIQLRVSRRELREQLARILLGYLLTE